VFGKQTELIGVKIISALLTAATCMVLPISLAFATISRVEGLSTCKDVKAVYPGRPQTAEVFGDGVDFVSQVTVSGSGMNAVLLGKKNGLENQARGKGFIGSAQIHLVSDGNTAPGSRTVTLKYPSGAQDTFTITVVARASITGVAGPILVGPFQEVEVIFDGSGLIDGVLTAQVTSYAGASGGAVAVNSVQRTTNTDTRVAFKLVFSQTLTQAALKLTLINRAGCSGLNAYPEGITKNLTLTAPAGTNYVTSITFPFRSTFGVGDVAKVRVTLQNTVSAPSGDVLYWQLEPANAFVQASGGSSYNPNQINSITIPQGSNLVDLSFQVARCPGSCVTCNVFIKTWRVYAGTSQAPYFKQAQFSINCRP
jgi:hypothetical protein